MQETSAGDRAGERELETREVIVDEPGLSQSTNQRLTKEVRDVVGGNRVRVPKNRSHPSKGEEAVTSSGPSRPGLGWLMMVISAFSALVVAGIIVSAATGSWWYVAVAFALDVIGVAGVAGVVLRMTAATDRPDPTLVAAMQEEGVVNPEQHFSQIVEEFTEADDDDEHRNATAQEDPAAAAAEQRSAVTPTSGPSKAVGP